MDFPNFSSMLGFNADGFAVDERDAGLVAPNLSLFAGIRGGSG